MRLQTLIAYTTIFLSSLSSGCIFEQYKTATFANGASSMKYSQSAKPALDNSLSLVMQMDGIKEDDEAEIEKAKLSVLRSADKYYGNDNLKVDKGESKRIYEQVNRKYLDAGLEDYSRESNVKDALKGRGF